jgi:hypothetical protein
MNLYQQIRDGGYAKRRRKILATKASENAKLCAQQRVWTRMVRRLTAPSH